MKAVDRGLPVLTEKPISDKLSEVSEIVRAVNKVGVKVAVIQNYRFTPRMLAFRELLRSGKLGRLQHLVARFQADYRVFGSWGAQLGLSNFRHEMEDPLVIDASIHHFDMIRNLTGGDCRTISGNGWNPPWSSFAGLSSGLYVCSMDNDTRALYEGNLSGAGRQNTWHHEHYRAECELGALSVGDDDVILLQQAGEPDEIVPVPETRMYGHQQIIGDYLDWLDGGDPPETVLDDNVKSTAMVFAAMEAGKSGETVDVSDFLPG